MANIEACQLSNISISYGQTSKSKIPNVKCQHGEYRHGKYRVYQISNCRTSELKISNCENFRTQNFKLSNLRPQNFKCRKSNCKFMTFSFSFPAQILQFAQGRTNSAALGLSLMQFLIRLIRPCEFYVLAGARGCKA